MLIPQEGKPFRKDVKRMHKRGKDLDKLKITIRILSLGGLLPLTHRDHALTGNFKGFRECHMEPDWLLIYQLTETHLVLIRTGSHTDLFR